jgi:hypothetical protein
LPPSERSITLTADMYRLWWVQAMSAADA